MYRYVFAVRNEPFCVWEHDLPERNERFLRSFDPGFLDYAVNVHLAELEGDNQARAAVALRTSYHHGLETLFSLLCATTQAPNCVAAWIPKCRNHVLRELVDDLSVGRPILTQRGRQRIGWEALSMLVHRHAWQKEEPLGATAARFAQLWQRLAYDFRNQSHIDEYNSVKHGFRVSSGGFALRMGLEPSFGVSPPESDMQWIGHSPHGTGYLSPEPLERQPENCRHHFRIRQRHLNWRAEAMAQLSQLIGWSITNVVGFLRILNGTPAATIQFNRPEDPDAFEAPWQWSVGVEQSNMDFEVKADGLTFPSKGELRAELEGRSNGPEAC